MSHPEIRALKLQNDLAALAEVAAASMSRIEASLTHGSLVDVRDAPALAWLPAELGVELIEVAHGLLRPGVERAWYRRAMERSLESALLGSFAETAASVFGRRPLSFLKWMTHTWETVYRGCGRLTLESPEPQGTRDPGEPGSRPRAGALPRALPAVGGLRPRVGLRGLRLPRGGDRGARGPARRVPLHLAGGAGPAGLRLG